MKRAMMVGIPWYNRHQYDEILDVMEDADTLPATYEEWLSRTEQLSEKMKRYGVTAVRVEIEPMEFVGWCANQGLRANADARMEYANLRAATAKHGAS